MGHTFDVLCIGKTTIDQFLVLNPVTLKTRLDPQTGFLSFKHGEKIEVDEVDFSLGGNATNVAIGLSRLGLSSALCSEIGDDEFSLKIHNDLEKEKIDRSFMIKSKNTPSSFSVILNYRGERTIFTRRIDRKNDFSFDDVTTKYIFLTSLDDEWKTPYSKALTLLVKSGCKLAFNPGTIQLHHGGDLVKQILEHTDILFVNKEEAEELVWGHEKRKRNNDSKYIRELLVKLQKMGAKTAVITNGRLGSHSIDEYGNFLHEGLFPGEVVERTGAGDAYTSGFLAAILYQKSVREAMQWGAINSANVVATVGAVAGLLKKDVMEQKEKEFNKIAAVKKRQYHPILEYAMGKLRLK